MSSLPPQVLEFVAFKERLQHSHSYAAAVAESCILQLQLAAATAGAGATAATSTTATALPTDSSSSSSGQPSLAQALTSSSKRLDLGELLPKGLEQMRFNADLTTRALWLPPCDGPPQLTVLWWWESNAAAVATAGQRKQGRQR